MGEMRRTSPQRTALLADAALAGFTVKADADGTVNVWRGHGARQTGITIWADGTATRLGTPLEVCTAIRTYAGMRRALGLKGAS